MLDTPTVMAGAAVLAGGTYAMRLGGPALRAKFGESERVDALIDVAATVLLVAVMVTTAFTEAGGFSGVARSAGVIFACVLAWYRTPFVVVILAAAGLTAGLRFLGVA